MAKNRKSWESPLFINSLRLLRMRKLFAALEGECGLVLDIGGRDFFPSILAHPKIRFAHWTCLEIAPSARDYDNDKYNLIVGDGEHTPFPDESFDTVLNVQVLEHTMQPLLMVKEAHRVLKQGGKAIFYIPQTSGMHEIPTHYYNFTRYWVEQAFADFTDVKITPIGGRWSTHASHMLHFFLEAFRVAGYSSKEYKRSAWFYVLFPFMAVYAFIGIGMGIVFTLGDLTEDPNNLLVIARK